MNALSSRDPFMADQPMLRKLRFPLVIGTTETTCALVSFGVLCFGFLRGSVLWFPSGFCALVSFGVLICYHLTSFLSRVLFYPTSCSSPLSFDTISALLSCVLHTISALSLYNFCSVIPVPSSVPPMFALLSLSFLSSLSVISVR